MGNLTWGGLELNKVEQIERDKVDSSLMLKKGDFLFNTRNTPGLVGKSAVWHGTNDTVTFDNNINRIRFNEDVDPDFVCAQLTYGPGKGRVRSLPAGSTSVAAIYWKDLKQLPIACPKRKEQTAIAHVLTSCDDSITAQEKSLSALKQQKKALMQQLLTGKVRVRVDGIESASPSSPTQGGPP
jgi:type I restriction enzyme, S subunit